MIKMDKYAKRKLFAERLAKSKSKKKPQVTPKVKVQSKKNETKE